MRPPVYDVIRIAIFPLILLSACSTGRPKWPAEVASAPADLEAKWKRYHWYVSELKTEITVQNSSDGYYSGPLAYVNYYLAAKALDEEGCDYVGTLKLPEFASENSRLEVTRIDSAGASRKATTSAMAERFRKSGYIVVPQVTKGTTVAVRIAMGPYTGINYWETFLDRNVPVYHGVMEITAARGLAFDCKAYNGLAGPQEKKLGFLGGSTLTWTTDRVMPMAALPYSDGMTARPRFLLTNRHNTYGTIYRNWADVAREKKKSLFATGMLWSSSAARKQARELIRGAEGEEEKARRLLEWTQDNVSQSKDKPGATRSEDAVLESRKGDVWHICLLLQAFYAEAGLSSEIALSRPREMGGFDSSTVNPEAAFLPLVIVKASGREWAACPYARGRRLGDYDDGLYGLPALAVARGALRALPEPAHSTARFTASQEIWLDAPARRQAVVELEGPFAQQAVDYRESHPGEDELHRCRAVLKNLGVTWSIGECSEDASGKSFRLRLKLEAEGAWVGAEEGQVWTQPDLFSRPAWFYDGERSEDYLLPYDQERKETVEFHGPQGRRLRVEVPCESGDGAPLKVGCSGGGGQSFTRSTVIRKGRYTAVTLAALRDRLSGLDDARQARVTAR
jgi:hypothetical protein